MVVKALFDAWRSGQVMRHMYNELLQMTEAAEWMFRTVGMVLFEGKDPAPVKDELYDTDRMVNKAERSIRKEIVEHLAVRPGGDVPACLVLMSLVKDAERVGDYCKNLFEIRDLLGEAFPNDKIIALMREHHARILGTFSHVREALAEADEDKARAIMAGESEVGHDLERMVRDVAESDLPARNAVARALALRHMKRVHAHLCNIASGVIQPVHRIDYHKKTKLSRKRAK